MKISKKRAERILSALSLCQDNFLVCWNNDKLMQSVTLQIDKTPKTISSIGLICAVASLPQHNKSEPWFSGPPKAH